MKILHLEASSGWGGQEMRILRESIGMRERGHEVILTVMKRGKLIEKARKEGFLVYECNFKKWAWPITLIRLLMIAFRHRIQLINTHSSLDSWIGGIAARLAKIPVLRTRHLSSKIRRGWNSHLLYGKLADYVVTTSPIAAEMIRDNTEKRDQCSCIPTGVDAEHIRVKREEVEAFRKLLDVKPGDFLIGTACFMRSWKGIPDLLKSADLMRKDPQVKWVIIGGGHAATYIQMAKERGLEGIVHFTGHLENPFPAIAALDVFALLSTAHEGISQAIIQAAYLKKPLIATPTGGLKEICKDQITGIQVPTFSPHEVSKAVVTLKSNPSLRERFGNEARHLVETHFTIQHTLDSMQEVYDKLVSIDN